MHDITTKAYIRLNTRQEFCGSSVPLAAFSLFPVRSHSTLSLLCTYVHEVLLGATASPPADSPALLAYVDHARPKVGDEQAVGENRKQTIKGFQKKKKSCPS